MVGQVIGKYRVLDRVGRGGMGTVYRATDETLHREVALKVLNAELNDPEVARRFRAEAITVARLSHPGIATIYELFQHDGQWLMVMEFVRGETLEHLVNRSGPLSPHRAAELCMQSLIALSHAHGLGVVHRDLKPANLMINETGAVKVMDFGIARVSGSEHLTNAGFMMGTPAYMAPEQVMGSDVDQRADLYAMGVVLYRLTTAKLPFKGETPFAMAQSQVNDPPTPIMLARPDLPTWVDSVIGRALSKAPKERYQSAAEFHEALARSVAGLPLLAPDDGSDPTELMTTPTRTPLATPYAVASGTPYATSSATPTMTHVPVSGRSAVPAPPTGSAPAAASAPSPEPPQAPPRPTRSNASVSILIAVSVLVVVGLLAKAWLGSRQDALPDASTTSVTPVDSAAQTPPADAPIPEAVPPPSLPGGLPPADPSKGQALPPPAATAKPNTPAPTGAQSVQGRGAVPTAASTPPAGVAPVPAPPVPPVDDMLAAFGDVKLVVANGRRGVERDVVINFGSGLVSVLPRDGGAVVAAVPYQRIRRATFVNARDPKWDPTLAAPPEGLDVGTVMRRARAWLVIQTADTYAILRLDTNATRIIETLEARTGIKVDRPAAGK